MTDRLKAEIKNIAKFTEEDIDFFIQSLEEKNFAKGEYFLREGQVSNHFGYIQNGLMMHYKIVDGVEIPTNFTKENGWVAYLKSFSTQTPSDIAIKALEDTSVLTLSSKKMGELFSTKPQLLAMRSYFTDISLIKVSEHATLLSSQNAKERYYKFMADYPDLINRIPQYHIAAYLGIKPQSLSRIRK